MIRVFPKQARGTEYIVLPPIIVEPNSVKTAPTAEYADKDVEIGGINSCTTQYTRCIVQAHAMVHTYIVSGLHPARTAMI